MKMKYFNQLSDIEGTLQFIISLIERAEKDPSDVNMSILESHETSLDDKDDILEEIKAVRYLISCQTMIARRDENEVKPSVEVANRTFHRVINQLLLTYNQKDTFKPVFSNIVAQKKYNACRHYLFKFSLPAWYAKLPSEVLTFENKWRNVEL